MLQILSSSGHSRSVVSLIFCSFSSVAPSRALIDILQNTAQVLRQQLRVALCRDFTALLPLSQKGAQRLLLHGMTRFHRIGNLFRGRRRVAEVLIIKQPAGVSLLVKQVATAVK